MNETTRQLVAGRATNRCEYCHLPQAGHEERFSVDHVVARKHRGTDDDANLAFCCLRCNLHKGTHLAGIDPGTGSLVPLFNPRTQGWEEHFRINSALIEGVTPTGRATAVLLNMNAPERARLRDALIACGLFAMT